jgi:hypothetical protein
VKKIMICMPITYVVIIHVREVESVRTIEYSTNEDVRRDDSLDARHISHSRKEQEMYLICLRTEILQFYYIRCFALKNNQRV